GRHELRHRPLVLRRRRAGRDDPARQGLGPPRPPGGHRRDARPPPPRARRRGHRLRGDAAGAAGRRLRRLGDDRAVPVRARPRGGAPPRPGPHPGSPDPPMSRLPASARLVRLPNLPGALSNVLLAAFAASAPPRLWPAVGLALLASACLYMAGMVWNDWFDLEQDRRQRPHRPLPSGHVAPDEAEPLGWGLMAGGLTAA